MHRLPLRGTIRGTLTIRFSSPRGLGHRNGANGATSARPEGASWRVSSGFELRFLRRDKCVIVDATFAAERHHVAVIAWVASGFCLLFGNGY